ncbi:MAG: hypothetical protein CO094_07455 [Anaerolineae bacterium CG_4_9_14_3_um_filter_57_17]|nr:hypothetical protein [bacterium]NCT21600.1 hypothetical protein [bacterium]OIO86194.1 MAG: hypothetical protein AUK01_03985 [Anaerolineae bacterium CG2_30_57_67]PJB66331.1 MAG: hypothetical protein CO094_07455 [Anaerolineae bacterium CG_4_9_14_3_um_filter_57_17]
MNTLFDRLRFFGSELVLGTLIALLSIITAVSAYQSSMADSDQTKNNVLGMQTLTDANAEYLTANQDIIQDYTNFDTYYLNTETNPDVADYFKSGFSEALVASMERPAGPFDEPYYEAMYAGPNEMFAKADEYFGLAEKYNEYGDGLQLVMLITALGLALAAWGSLLKDDSKIRVLFAIFGLVMLVYGIIRYIGTPGVTG